MRLVLVAVCLFLVLAGCGGSEMTEGQYAQEMEALSTALYAEAERLASEVLAEETPSGIPPAANLQDAYRGIAAAYRDFRDGVSAIDPPSDIAELHDELVDMATRLASTSEALSAKVDEFEDGDDWDALMRTQEARASEAVQEEIVGFCQERQAELDATADREGLSDVPWIPPEMQEVILVAFGCER